ncbi:MAG: helix-turn-helix transcriptional regulator [Lachnospiraceae bacterium]|jgi:DNA-binding XRE family transcriptional regulator|nr:helix-turn-helix transcriptional regulator [Lachnospiraceae bacterium]MBR4581429.1 helix-turn-helix transcriptional regulator [Lachnospiraceae bacterium]
MRRTRTTLDHVGSAERRFNNWLRCKLSETDEVTKKKKYRQREVAEYIGISQQHLSAKMTGKTPWSLTQALSAVDYFGTTMGEVLK